MAALVASLPAARGQYWTLDESFAPSLESAAGADGVVIPIALPGGAVLIATSYSYLNGEPIVAFVRVKPDGTRDPNFVADLPAGADITHVYADGKLLATVDPSYPDAGYVHRLLSDGSLDPTFTPTKLDTGGYARAKPRPDGKIWVFGRFAQVAGHSRMNLARLQANGGLDTSFASPFADINTTTINGLADQPDGKVVLAGGFSVGGVQRNVIRLNTDGTIDGGFVAELGGFIAYAAEVSVLANGKIMVTDGRALRRLNPDGSADTGYVPAFQSDPPARFVGLLRASGSAYVVMSNPSEGRDLLRRLNPDGSWDASFSVTTPSGAPDTVALPVTWDESTYYMGTGVTRQRTQDRQVLSKLDAAGALQSSYAPRFSRWAAIDVAGRLADGSYLLTGIIDYATGVRLPNPVSNAIRLNADGRSAAPVSLPESASIVGLEQDGHFTGFGDFGTGWTFARFSPAGTLLHAFSAPVGSLTAADANGRLYATDSSNSLKRYAANGVLDSSFSADLSRPIGRILPAANGKVYVLLLPPSHIEPSQLIRLLANGATDAAFPPIDYFSAPLVVTVLPDGGVLTVEEWNLPEHSSYLQFIRRNAAGETVYAYRGTKDAFVIAGVAFDSLQAGQVNGAITVRAPNLTGNPPLLPNWIHVRSDGELSIASGTLFDARGPLVRYRRSALSSPSVPTAPVIAVAPAARRVAEGDTALLSVTALGLEPFTYQWYHKGTPLSGSNLDRPVIALRDTRPASAGAYSVKVTNQSGSVTSAAATLTVDASPVFADSPVSHTVTLGSEATFAARLSGGPGSIVQWTHNGSRVAGSSNSLTLRSVQPADAGLYAATASNGLASATSDAAILGLSTTQKVVGQGTLLQPENIRHPNGNTYDQILLTGSAEAITAEFSLDPAANQITRTSFVDLDNDIVQVEFSGPGTLCLVLDEPTGPSLPLHYNQAVNYMKGHASIVITGATEHTNVSIFSVGRATAVDPTGRFNVREPVSAGNNPANNGSPLFSLTPAPEYDGIAEIGFIAISSANGKFGGVRTANVHYYTGAGITGLYAPGVAFEGPIFIGDITAFNQSTPVLLVGQAGDVRITGGDMEQQNGEPVAVSGFAQLRFTAGTDSHGRALSAQANAATFERDGTDVTAQIVVNP